MYDILLVEDNVEFAQLLQAFLNKEGFSLYHVENGEDALLWLSTHTIKILLLDIMLPGMDGFAVCQSVRQQGDVPILILSAKTQKEDKLKSFDIGADDYIEKPIDIEVLIAKIRSLYTRIYGHRKQPYVQSGGLRVQEDARKVYIHDELIELNVKEYELLLLFVKNPGKTMHKEFLFNYIWGSDSESEMQTLTVHVQMLRNKIEEDAKHPKRIQTVWGIGYRYEEV